MSVAPLEAPSSRRRFRGRRAAGCILAAIVLGAASLARWGNSLEEIAMYLPLVRSLAGTWPAPADDHLALLEELPLWWCRVDAFFEARGGLLPALLVQVVLARALLAASGIALAAALGGRGPLRHAGALLLVLAAPASLTPAHFRLLQPEALPAALAIPLVLFAIALAARRREGWGAVLVGLAANAHPPLAASVFPGFLAAVFVSHGKKDGKRAAARACLVAAVVAAPTAVFVLARATGDLGGARGELYAIARETAGGHLFPSRWDGEAWASALALAGLVLAVSSPTEKRRGFAPVLAASLAGLAVFAVGLALAEAELLPVVLLKAHLARAALATKGIALVLAGRWGLRALGRGGLGAIAAALVVAGLLEDQGVAAVGIALAAVERLSLSGKKTVERRELAYAMLALGLASAALSPGEASAIARALVLAGALAAVSHLSRALSRRALIRRRRAAALAATLGLAAVVVSHHLTRLEGGGVGVRFARLGASPHAEGAGEREALARFLERTTPVTSRLLLPPDERLLLFLPGRSVVASASWGTLAIWDLRFGRGELDRLARLGYSFGDPDRERAYHRWPPARILDAARALGATHVVVDRALGDPPLGPPIYESARFRVYAVSP